MRAGPQISIGEQRCGRARGAADHIGLGQRGAGGFSQSYLGLNALVLECKTQRLGPLAAAVDDPDPLDRAYGADRVRLVRRLRPRPKQRQHARLRPRQRPCSRPRSGAGA